MQVTCKRCNGKIKEIKIQPSHTHNHLTALWSRTNRVGRYQKKHSPTYTHPDHQTSFLKFLHLLRSIADWLGLRVGGHPALSLHSSDEPGELSQWLWSWWQHHTPMAIIIIIASSFIVQFTCLTVLFHNLSPGPLWSSSWSRALYFILHAIKYSRHQNNSTIYIK